MIYGIGVDNVEISRIEKAKEKRHFVEKVLSKNELNEYDKLGKKRQTEYLAGRWAAKEAYSKAFGTGIAEGLDFLDLETAADDKGNPYFSKHPFTGQSHLSISHTDLEAIAMLILESENK